MEIKLLRLLSETPLSISAINSLLQQNSLETLNQIAKINSYHHNLINCIDGCYGLNLKLNWLNKELLISELQKKQLEYSIHILDQIDSTNSYALKNIEQFANKTIISTDWQNSGRGRFGRTWVSKIAHDITLSVVYTLPPEINPALLPAISAVAINRLLKNHSIANSIKWPNDIFVNDAKVAGILVENLVRGKQMRTVIGIGLNNFANWDRNLLLVELVQSLDNVIREFELFGFALLRREWLDNCLHLNKQVSIIRSEQLIDEGVHKDLGTNGELIIANKTGDKSYSTSEISLKIKG